MAQQGFIMLHRSIQQHWIYDEKRKFSNYEAWLDLLMMVNHKDNKVLQDGELVEVKRGERITSIRQLMDRWTWSNTKVVKFLNLLKSDEMIEFEITPKKKTLIKIVKYHEYQGFQGVEQSEEKTQKRQRKDTETTQNNINNNDNNANNENKKDIPSKSLECDYELSQLLFSLMLENNDKAKKPNFETWANHIRLMREKDGYTVEQIQKLIEWSQRNTFWKSNILSAKKLRDKAGTLRLQRNEEIEKRGSKRTGSKKKVSLEELNLSDE